MGQRAPRNTLRSLRADNIATQIDEVTIGLNNFEQEIYADNF